MSDKLYEEFRSHFINQSEKSNARRAGYFNTFKKFNRLVAFTTTLFVVGSYGYSVYSIRKERSLGDAFDKLPSDFQAKDE